MFEKFAVSDHAVEFSLVDEMVIAAIGLARPAWPRRHRHRQRQGWVALEQKAGDGRLAGAGGRRQHQEKPAAPDRGRLWIQRASRWAHSRFCTCSRNCSTATLSASPIRVSSMSADFE